MILIKIRWHQDVKPRNILVLSGKSDNRYDVEFKLADLGLSHFKRTVKPDQIVVDGDRGGTKDYGKWWRDTRARLPKLTRAKGAPECYRADEFLGHIKINVTPSIDIWSFGGVCSDAAVWVVLGLSGLTDYRKGRQQEISDNDSSQDGSCFHDGENVLDTVQNMHLRLLRKGEVRPGDHVTKSVIQHMVPFMLHKDPNERFEALSLYKISQNILEGARSESKGSNQLTAPRTVGSVHQHSSPPYDPKYSTNLRRLREPSSTKETLTRRSDTWYERSVETSAAPDSYYGNQFPPGSNHTFQEPKRTVASSSDESMTESRTKLYQSASRPSYSPPDVLGDGNALATSSAQHQGFSEFHLRRTESGQEGYQEQNCLLPALAILQANGISGSPQNPDPPCALPVPELSARKKKPMKPFLSFHKAEQIRASRGVLPQEARHLLKDLETRDHVSSYTIFFFSTLMIYY